MAAQMPTEVVENATYGDEKTRQVRLLIAENLARAIDESGISQNAVGRMLGVGSSTMSSWRKGRTQPSLEQVALLCLLLGVTADDILGTGALHVEPPGPDAPPDQVAKAKHAIRGAFLIAKALLRVAPADSMDAKGARMRAAFEDLQARFAHLDHAINEAGGLDVVAIRDETTGAKRLAVVLKNYEESAKRRRGRASASARKQR